MNPGGGGGCYFLLITSDWHAICAEEIENIAERVSSNVSNRGDKSLVIQKEMMEAGDRCFH